MDIVSLILGGIISTVIISILLFVGKNSKDQSIKLICGLIIFVILFLDIWPFIEHAFNRPSPENIVEVFEDLAVFLIALIGGALVYPFLPKSQRDFFDQL
jgi:hypothetical protein